MMTKQNRPFGGDVIDTVLLLKTGESLILKVTDAKNPGRDPLAIEAIAQPQGEC